MAPARRDVLVLGAAGLAAAAAGFLAGPALLRLGGAGQGALGTAIFPDLTGRPRQLAEWRGKILVCNFWATWCAPCREEIPLLLSARQKYGSTGVEIVGIAIDNPAKVREFSATFNIVYPVLLAEAEGLDLMRALGNSSGGLPYTVITDRAGAPLHRKLGALKGQELDGLLRPLAQT